MDLESTACSAQSAGPALLADSYSAFKIQLHGPAHHPCKQNKSFSFLDLRSTSCFLLFKRKLQGIVNTWAAEGKACFGSSLGRQS